MTVSWPKLYGESSTTITKSDKKTSQGSSMFTPNSVFTQLVTTWSKEHLHILHCNFVKEDWHCKSIGFHRLEARDRSCKISECNIVRMNGRWRIPRLPAIEITTSSAIRRSTSFQTGGLRQSMKFSYSCSSCSSLRRQEWCIALGQTTGKLKVN